MRSRLALLLLVLACAFAWPAHAWAQAVPDGSGAVAPPVPAGVQELRAEADAARARYESVRADRTAGLTSRRDALRAALERAQQRLDRLESSYSGDGEALYSGDDVRRRIRALEDLLRREVRGVAAADARRERAEIDRLLRDAWERQERGEERAATLRAAAEAAAGGREAWEAERPAWDAAQADLTESLRLWVQEAETASELLDECADLRGRRERVLRATVDLLRRENLFLRGRARISVDALGDGLRDVARLPAWLAATVAAALAFARAPDAREEVVSCAAVAALALLLLGFARVRVRRHVRPPAEVTTDAARVRDLAWRLAASALFAALLGVVPFLVGTQLSALDAPVAAVWRHIGVTLAVWWFARSVVRRLLPVGDRWSPLTVDARAAALLRSGGEYLLGLSACFLPLLYALEQLGYGNEGAREALRALYELGVVVVLLVFVFRRDAVMGLLPAPTTRVGALARGVVARLHPLLVLVGPLLFVLDLLEYDLLAEFLARSVGAATAAVALGFTAYGALWRGTETWLHSVVGDGETGGRNSVSHRDAAGAIARYVLTLVAIGLAGAVGLLVLGTGFSAARSLLAVDLPLQAADAARHVTWWDVLASLAVAVLTLTGVGRLRLFLDAFVLPRTALDTGVRYTISALVGYVVAALGLYAAVRQIFELESLGYVVTALSVGIGFGLQEIVSNFFSGIILLFERPLKVGDLVTVGDTEGWVTKINIRATTIQTRDNVSMLIPNKDFVTQAVVNADYGDPIVRVRIGVGVAYGSDTDLVKRVLADVAREHPRVMTSRSVDVFFLAFGESSLDFELRCWIPEASEQPRIASELRFAIDRAFREHAIEIPFPQRDLHLRSSDVPLGAARPTPPPDGDAGN